jgi:hypothetical protein
MSTSSKLCVVGLVLAVTPASAAPQRHRSVAPLVIDYVSAPKTLDGFFEHSDLVTVVTLGVPSYPVMKGPPTTHFKANVEEVIRSSGTGPVGPVIDVYRYGGKIQGPTGPMDDDELHFARWRSGMRLLLFLRWNKAVGEYVPLVGPDGAYELEPISGKVRAFGRGKVASALHAHSITAVLDEVRQAARK